MNRWINILLNLFFVVAIVDAANIFTGIKTKLFVVLLFVLILSGRKNIQKKYFAKVAITMLISTICFFCGRVYGYPVSFSFFFQYSLSFCLLLILAWDKFFCLEKGMWISANILAYGTILAYLFCFMFPQFKPIVENFSRSDDGTAVIYISSRTFLGVNFDGVFYTPLAFVVLPCTIALYRLNYKGHRLYNFYLALLYSFALFCGGNRACMMCVTILWGGFGLYILVRKHPLLRLVILPCCLLGIISLFLAFTQEKGESSNETKQLHLLTYSKILDTNPLAFVTGMGAGSQVYSKGFMQKTVLMEWTYLELIRFYGVFSLYVLCLFYKPVWYLWKYKQYYEYAIPVSLGCLLYMLSSYGNPYLINSTGFCLLIYLYWYIDNKWYVNNGK